MDKNRQEIMRETAKVSGYKQEIVDGVMRALFDVMKSTVVENGSCRVDWLYLGTKDIPTKEFRNPKTNETFTKPAHYIPVVKLGTSLKNAVKEIQNG